MRYILHNVRSLCKKEPFLFFVMIICIFSSAMIMLFSYGLYQNYHVQRYEAEVDLKELYPAFQDGAELHKADLVRYMSALSGDTLDAMDIIYTTARLEEFPETNYAEIPFRFCIRNGAYCTSSITIEQTNGYKVQISFINLQKNADIAINERTYIYDRCTLQLPPG